MSDIEQGNGTGTGTDTAEPALSTDTSKGDIDLEGEEAGESSPFRGAALDMEPPTAAGKEKKFSLMKRVLASVIAMVVAIVFFVVVAVTVNSAIEALPTEGPKNASAPGRFRKAAVAADVGSCSEIGRDILKQGGTAVDAVISSLLCVGVINPQSSGLGGGMFMLLYHKGTAKVEALMARERAPAAATANMTLEKFGATSIAVPGELSGMWEAHQRYGKLPWKDLFGPIIRLAEEGFPATAHLAGALGVMASRIPDIESRPEFDWFVAKYTNQDGSWKAEGDIVYAHKMARTLRAIAKNGISELATGETGQQLVQEIQEMGGIITAADLAGYTAQWMEPQTFSIGRGMTVVTTPSPSGGPVVQFIINILRNYNISSADFKTSGDQIKAYHRFVEASKFAFALRSYLGDVDTPEVQEVLNNMQSEEFSRSIFSKIRDDRVTYVNATGYDALVNMASPDGGTCHISVVDQDGNAASATSSVNYYFGSRILSNKTGLILNNEMADFDTPASQPASSANYIAPGKMPLSAMSPVIVLNENGHAELVAGSAGSRAIITTNAWVTLRSLFTDATLKEIIDEKRIHNQLQPQNVAVYEEGFPVDVIDGLVNMGHVVSSRTIVSILQAIRKTDDGWVAYSDPRKQGYPAGY